MIKNEFIPISLPSITSKEIDFVTDAVKSTWVSSIGKYIDQFEHGFAKFSGADYGVAVMNGTVAIQLALECLGIGPGDEVIIPDLSFIATANAVLYVGAIPVFVDVEPETFCMDPAKLEGVVTSRTKAIIPVHLYGHPADMGAISDFARDRGLYVVEDAAEAHGATVNGRPVGSWGDIATFSFYGNKNLTTGEGGMLLSSNKEWMDKARFLRDHAMSKEKRYFHEQRGYNFRMTNLQAALGCAQVERVSELLGKRKQIFNWYNQAIGDRSDILLNKTKSWATNSYWLVTAYFPGGNEKMRDQIMSMLKERGIDSRPFFFPMTSMPYLSQYRHENLRTTYEVSPRGINLPTYFDLDQEKVAFISHTLIEIVESI